MVAPPMCEPEAVKRTLSGSPISRHFYLYISESLKRIKVMSRVITFVRRIAGLLEPSLESEFFEEFTRLSKYLDRLIVVSEFVDDSVDISSYGNLTIHKVKTIKLPKLHGFTKILSYCYAVFKYRRSIDVIYIRTFSPPESIALWFGKHFLRKRAVLIIPGTWLFEPPTMKNKLFRWIFSKAIYSSDAIILYSPLMLPAIENYFPKLRKEKIVYLHNAVDTQRFKPGKPAMKVLEKYVPKRGGRILLYVGRISARKGVLDLVRAFSIIQREADVILLLAGREDRSYARQVRGLIRELHLESRIVLLGPVPNKEVVELMKACEVFLYASIGGEGIPRAILEAMACGKPVVATKVAGIPEAVKDGETGFLVDVGDYKAIARRTLEILRNEKLRARLGDNARKLIEKEFDYKVIIPELAKILREASEMRL